MTEKDTLMGCYSTTSLLRWGWDGVGVGIGVGVEETGGDGRVNNKMTLKRLLNIIWFRLHTPASTLALLWGMDSKPRPLAIQLSLLMKV